ncbi:hypothetical protein [Actinomycetospora lemnae]|uniref:Uncharacterized protein n=1 Tax=Actinomycetospora lemnae TaxID=3019891 RepID=A0ABT5SYL6_9PSEU|nr:hypothetical protein [Actinomycetospora sp. DW7H6]MDD7967958.1 hypothetical protein [Actinomycetospora sp. DW7H6]
MFLEMHGIGCAHCGQATWAWVDDRLWPCGCSVAALGRDAEAPALLVPRRALVPGARPGPDAAVPA